MKRTPWCVCRMVILLLGIGITSCDVFVTHDPSLRKANPGPYLGSWEVTGAKTLPKGDVSSLKITEEGLLLDMMIKGETLKDIPCELFQIPETDWIALSVKNLSQHIRDGNSNRKGDWNSQLFLLHLSTPDTLEMRVIARFGEMYIPQNPDSGGVVHISKPKRNDNQPAEKISEFQSLTPELLTAIHKAIPKGPQANNLFRKKNKDLELTKREQNLSDYYSMPVRQINFRDAHISDVVEELVRISREMDPERQGVGIVFMDPEEEIEEQPEGAPVDAPDPFGAEGGFGAPLGVVKESADERPTVKPVTLELKDVTLMSALNIVTELAELEWKVDEKGKIRVDSAKENGE